MRFIYLTLVLFTINIAGQSIVDVYKPPLFNQDKPDNNFCTPYKIKFTNDSLGLMILIDVRSYNAIEGNINIDSLYVLKFEGAVSNLKPLQKVRYFFSPKEVCKQFNASIGLTTSIKLMCDTVNYKDTYCTVSYFYKTGIGEVWVYYLSSDIDKIRKYLISSNDAALIFRFK